MEFKGLTSASHMSLQEAGYGSEEGQLGSEISGAVSGVTTPGASRLQTSQSQERSTTMQRLHFGVRTHFVPQIAESYPAQSVPLEASTRKECFERKKLHPRRDSFCNGPPHTCRDPVIIWSFGNLIACTMTMGSKHTLFPKIEESDPAQSVPLEASTRKECFERRKFHPRRYSFCNKPLQTSGDRVIIWSFENLIGCTITMGSKHTSFPRLKNQTSPKVCPWERLLASSFLREKNSIRRGTHFVINPFKRPEIV